MLGGASSVSPWITRILIDIHSEAVADYLRPRRLVALAGGSGPDRHGGRSVRMYSDQARTVERRRHLVLGPRETEVHRGPKVRTRIPRHRWRARRPTWRPSARAASRSASRSGPAGRGSRAASKLALVVPRVHREPHRATRPRGTRSPRCSSCAAPPPGPCRSCRAYMSRITFQVVRGLRAGRRLGRRRLSSCG